MKEIRPPFLLKNGRFYLAAGAGVDSLAAFISFFLSVVQKHPDGFIEDGLQFMFCCRNKEDIL